MMWMPASIGALGTLRSLDVTVHQAAALGSLAQDELHVLDRVAHGLQSTHSLIVFAPNNMFWRTARTISSGLSRHVRMSRCCRYISGVGQNWPPVEPIIGPEGMSVGPQPACSIAMRSATSTYRALLPTSRTTVKPESSSCIPLEAAWIARSGVESWTYVK